MACETNTCKNIFPALQKWLDLTIQYRHKEKALEDRIARLSGGLCINEFYLLYFMAKRTEHKMRLQDAQEMIAMSQSAMSRLIKRLEANNPPLLWRSTCEQDKRAVYIHLTDEGQAMYEKIAEGIKDIVDETAENVSI